jgi:hypothetical protein
VGQKRTENGPYAEQDIGMTGLPGFAYGGMLHPVPENQDSQLADGMSDVPASLDVDRFNVF